MTLMQHERVRDRSGAPVLATSAALVVGLIAARSPEVALAAAVLLPGLLAFVLLVRRLDAGPRTPLDVALWSAVVLLPIAPFLTTIAPPLTLLRLLPAAIVVGGMLLGAVRPVPQWGGLQWSALLFAAYQFVPLALAPGGYGLTRWVNWVVFIPFAFALFDRRSMRVALAATATTGALLVTGVVLQSLGLLGGTWGGAVLGGAGTVEEVRVTRYTSFLLNPNDLAQLSLIVVVASVAAFGQAGRRTRVLLLMLTMALVGVSLLTASRGALLGGAVVLAWMTVRARLRQAVGVLLAGCIAVCLLVLLVPAAQTSAQSTVGSLSAIVNGKDVSADARVALWHQRLSAGQRNPVVGVGYGGYALDAAATNIDLGDGEARKDLYRVLTVDNGWLRLYLESGLLGVVLLGAVIVAAVWSSVLASSRGRYGVWPDALAALLLAMCARGVSADVFDINPWNFVLWLLVGLISSMRSAEDVDR